MRNFFKGDMTHIGMELWQDVGYNQAAVRNDLGD
jgi:hypothetical protein